MYERLLEYSKNNTSFHMPGHKSGALRLIEDVYPIDITEVDGVDDLHHPRGIIKELQEHIADIYNAGKSYLLVNGSTVGIMSSISALAQENHQVLIARNCHKSVYNSIYINQLDPKFVYPEYNETYNVYEELNPERLEDIMATAKVNLVVITSPTYEGVVSDIKSISEIVHGYGGVLIVDEAHGAHFNFSQQLPTSALELGADIVIHSTHKTLPCFTQTGVLHISKDAIKSKRVNSEEIQKYLSIYQTSSPSYILMSSIEKGIEYMDSHRKTFSSYIHGINDLFSEFKSSYGIWNNMRKDKVVDISRLTYVIQPQLGITGWALGKALRDKNHIQVELTGYGHIVGITTMADSIEEIQRFIIAVEERMKELVLNHHNGELNIYGSQGFRPIKKMSILKASKAKGVMMTLKDSLDQVMKEYIIPYPPGIPILVPGEIMSNEILQYLSNLVRNDMEVYGIIEGEVQVLNN